MPEPTQVVELVPHPATPSAAARSIVVHLKRGAESLAARYVLQADLARVRVPKPGRAQRAGALWRHTCFEMFVAPGGSAAYQEFNFSPSCEWAAYGFTGYREGGVPLGCPVPSIAVRTTASALELDAAIACAVRGPVNLGLSAVVEEEDGRLSYWALRHGAARPDFHAAAAFALELDELRH
jgi:hypothetical protein